MEQQVGGKGSNGGRQLSEQACLDSPCTARRCMGSIVGMHILPKVAPWSKYCHSITAHTAQHGTGQRSTARTGAVHVGCAAVGLRILSQRGHSTRQLHAQREGVKVPARKAPGSIACISDGTAPGSSMRSEKGSQSLQHEGRFCTAVESVLLMPQAGRLGVAGPPSSQATMLRKAATSLTGCGGARGARRRAALRGPGLVPHPDRSKPCQSPLAGTSRCARSRHQRCCMHGRFGRKSERSRGGGYRATAAVHCLQANGHGRAQQRCTSMPRLATQLAYVSRSAGVCRQLPTIRSSRMRLQM